LYYSLLHPLPFLNVSTFFHTFQRGTCAYNDMEYTVTKNGVQADIPDTCEGSTVQIPGVEGTYKALQFHIHTSSEHTLDGNRFSAELHTVHKQIDGDRYAVVGMMIQPNAFEDNEEFALLLQGWYKKEEEVLAACGIASTSPETGAAAVSDEVFSPYDLLPEGHAFYHYDGGLTTPPCSEVVWWNLADKSVSVSVWQYSELVQLILKYRDPDSCELVTLASASGGTSRPVQNLNGREVKRICPVGFEEDESSAATLSVSLAAIAAVMAGFFL
jgi:carbonic anhydrase